MSNKVSELVLVAGLMSEGVSDVDLYYKFPYHRPREWSYWSPSGRHATKRRGVPGKIRTAPKVGRNAPCPCGSGRKFKVCCIHKKEEDAPSNG